MGFTGFTNKTFEFLIQLGFNNNKSWFEENKVIYKKFVLNPFQELVNDLSPFMLSIDRNFITAPLVDKTISRIYRDVRFSKDKSPYRNSVWLTFKRSIKEWKNSPAYYFEISPEGWRYGMGFYDVEKSTMDKFREMIDKKPSEFLKAIAFYKKSAFTLQGDKYKKFLDPSKPLEVQEWYQRKFFYLTDNGPIEDILFSPDLVNKLLEGFGLLKPLYTFLWKNL